MLDLFQLNNSIKSGIINYKDSRKQKSKKVNRHSADSRRGKFFSRNFHTGTFEKVPAVSCASGSKCPQFIYFGSGIDFGI